MSRPIALITGGHRRVGRAIAGAFATSGFDLVITCNRSGEDAQETARALGAAGCDVRVETLDLAEPDAVHATGTRLAEELPRLDVLIHNASVYSPTALEDITATDTARVMQINALSPLLLSGLLAGHLRASPQAGGGSIVCMCDIHAMGEHGLPRAGFAPYAMSKSALLEMMRSLARELAPAVRVNAVAPGVVAWPEAGYESDRPTQEAYLSRVPLGRAGTPEDAAEAVRWLATDARYTTGQVIRVDGGRTMR